MSGGKTEDWDNTRDGKTNDRQGCTWLRHRLGTMAALIDKHILEGKYSADDIADDLSRNFFNTSNRKTRRDWVDRVADHVAHLESDNNGGGDPHNLIVHEDMDSGILSFNFTIKPGPCKPLPFCTRTRRKFKCSRHQ